MTSPYVNTGSLTYGTIDAQGNDNSNSSTAPSAGGGKKLTFNDVAPSGSNAATQQFVSGDDAGNSYGSMEPQPNPGNASTMTTVPKGTSSMSPNFNGTNVPGAQNIPASGYSQTWKGGGA